METEMLNRPSPPAVQLPRKFNGTELVVATHNRGKLAEFDALFSARGHHLQLSIAADYGLPSPEETGTTFIENAQIKALFAAQVTGKPCLADDSGLCIDALGGAPGVYSADWAEPAHAGEGRDFDAAMNRVRAEMGEIWTQPSPAHFVSVIMLAWPDGHCEYVEGIARGHIIWPPRGQRGHGYDPMFVPMGHKTTYAEMDPSAKNAISHRALAFQKIMDKCFK